MNGNTPFGCRLAGCLVSGRAGCEDGSGRERRLRTTVLAAVLACGLGDARAPGAHWVSAPNSMGELFLPTGYRRATESLTLSRFTLEDLPVGAIQPQWTSPSFSVTGTPQWAIARPGPVAGTEPTSPPMALLVPSAGSTATKLHFNFHDPVRTVGFALMGIKSSAWVKVYGDGNQHLYDGFIDSGQAGARRWIGVDGDGRDIFSVRLEPTDPGEYGVDDIELGRDMPEPASLAGWMGVLLILRHRRGETATRRSWSAIT